MKKYILSAICFLFLSSPAYALDLSRVKTWSTSEILTAADLNGEFNNILNHSLTNNDIDAAAGIVGSKLNLSSPGIIGATAPAAATYTTLTINSTSIFKDKMSFTQTDNNEYIDSLADGYLDFEATTGLRFRINTAEQVNLTDGIFAPTTDNDIDLGSTTKEFKDLWITGTANVDSLVADTADINGGTMDGVQVGGTTATGELLVNDASDDADGLGSQGTSGQFLQSAGAGANPTWAIDNYPSNVLFQYNGQVDGLIEYVGTSLFPTSGTIYYRFLQKKSAAYATIWTTRWIKTAGAETITILCRIWIRTGVSNINAPQIKVDVGGQNGSVIGTYTTDPTSETSPEWKSFTIDVSGLTDGTTYDVTASIHDVGSTGGPDNYCSNIIAIGS